MNRETRTKVNEKAVMMAINPLMLDVDIVPRGLDTPGIADGVGVAIAVRGRLAIDEYDGKPKSPQAACHDSDIVEAEGGGAMKHTGCANFRTGKVQREPD
jgi:hypothetical protein